jgi:hypothetical protein
VKVQDRGNLEKVGNDQKRVFPINAAVVREIQMHDVRTQPNQTPDESYDPPGKCQHPAGCPRRASPNEIVDLDVIGQLHVVQRAQVIIQAVDATAAEFTAGSDAKNGNRFG